MEFKINNYVRTKQGNIGKATIITEYNTCIEDKKVVRTKDIIKSSPNIIDLIKVGDYVNGYKVLEVLKHNVPGESLIAFQNHNNILSSIYDNEIKSIVTNEQFSQMEYKIESKDK